MATWRKKLTTEMHARGDGWGNLVSWVVNTWPGSDWPLDEHYMPVFPPPQTGSTPAADWLDLDFDDGFGCKEGHAFTLWTTARVYFPTEYDGAEHVHSVPRYPCAEAPEHKRLEAAIRRAASDAQGDPMDPMENPTCSTCPYYHAAQSLCRRRPPERPWRIGDVTCAWSWPAAAPSDWCGEHPALKLHPKAVDARRDPA